MRGVFSLLVLLISLLAIAVAVDPIPVGEEGKTPTRNAREEEICRPFLTSKETSPLIRTLKRDFRVDEDGEFSCELVLQDVNLPAQIRITIHEGLSLLMQRHIAVGKERHKTLLRHLRLLAQYIPTKFSFSYNAGRWALVRAVSQPEQAVENLRNCVYGKASSDKTATNFDKRQAQVEYAKALGYLGRYKESRKEYGRLLKKSLGFTPEHFGLMFQARETANNYKKYVLSY